MGVGFGGLLILRIAAGDGGERDLEIVDGAVTARGPGLGLEWDEAAVAKYQV